MNSYFVVIPKKLKLLFTNNSKTNNKMKSIKKTILEDPSLIFLFIGILSLIFMTGGK